jgi:TadE-like protein
MNAERRRQKGASMTEFIIITPVALLLMLSILQFALVYMAKSTLNTAVFMAARQGANQNASMSAIQGALARGLIPFHLQTSENEPGVSEMTQALGLATADMLANGRIEIVSPAPQAFTHFGLRDQNNQTYIPNDNLEYRSAETRAGPGGGVISIRDANVLKLQVTYGYELKVPLVSTVLRKVMCLGQAGGGEVDAWKSDIAPFDPGRCQYWQQGRIPLVAQATVQMQSNAYEGERIAGLDGVGGSSGGGGPGGGSPGGGGNPGGGNPGGGGDTGGGNPGGGGDTGGGNPGGGDTGGGTCF